MRREIKDEKAEKDEDRNEVNEFFRLRVTSERFFRLNFIVAGE